MKNIITNAAEITVLRLIDNTFKTGGGPVSVGATCLVASKGLPFKVIQVVDSNWQNIFGKPLQKKADNMEGLRHLADAVKDCTYVNVVRVVPEDAKFPSVTIKTTDGVTAAAAHTYGTDLSLGTGICLQIYLVDGDESVNRSFKISHVNHGAWVTLTPYKIDDIITVIGGRLICTANHTSGATAPSLAALGTDGWVQYNGVVGDNRFLLTFFDKDEEGTEYELESYVVGVNVTDKDDMGAPAYIETVLEQKSDVFRCNFDESLTYADVAAALKAVSGTKVAFVGGTNGTFTDDAERVTQFKKAWDLFRNEQYLSNLMFAAGNYDGDVIANCIDIANKNHNSFFYDINPTLTPDLAIAKVKELGVESRQAACYYSPYAASDAFYGGKTVWGVSGAVAAACAQGDANFSGSTPGVHYAPAGIYRGKLARTGLKALNSDLINRDDFYTYRINPVIASDTGGAVIDDCLSVHFKQNYSRFIWVNRIANYIDHRFVEAAAYMKFEPDGLTRNGLTKLTKQILDELVVSGALVTPRDPADGTSPYLLKVEQVEIDLWLVTWDFCPTGAARRIAGQPRLIK